MVTDADGLTADAPNSAAMDAGAEAEHQRALIDADRIMMQIVQTSISLIGFGFTINAFFNDVAVREASIGADLAARRMGLALLCLGLAFLGMGIWNQVQFRRGLWARHRNPLGSRSPAVVYSAVPSIVLAVLLLLVGVAALVSAVLRMVV